MRDTRRKEPRSEKRKPTPFHGYYFKIINKTGGKSAGR